MQISAFCRSDPVNCSSSIYSATTALLAQHKDNELEQQIELAAHYWNTVNIYIANWEQVLQRKVSAGEMRQDYVIATRSLLRGWVEPEQYCSRFI